MANSFQDLSQMLVPLADTFKPQSLTVTGAGTGVDVRDVGVNRINARLHLGAAVALTTLDVKMQAGIDDANYVDISGATFAQVTSVSGFVPETISFQLPAALSFSASPYNYVRAYATLDGTSVLIAVSLEACAKFDGGTAYQNAPGNDAGNVIN